MRFLGSQFWFIVTKCPEIQVLQRCDVYSQQGVQKSFENFINTRRRFKENESFKTFCERAEKEWSAIEDEKLFKEKRDLLGFFWRNCFDDELQTY